MAMRNHSLLRWAFLCWFGLHHRKGETWYRVQRGKAPQKTNRCSRCGIRNKGALAH